MCLALTDLDTGLFFEKAGWTTDHKLAQKFADRETVSNMAKERNVKNAAAAIIDGEPPQVRGYYWITTPI
jgi:hypothetical protein